MVNPKVGGAEGAEGKESGKGEVAWVSAATVDWLLRSECKQYELKLRARTKPGTLLNHKLAIRTFSEWDEAKSGFLEIDLVSHDGEKPRGIFVIA